MKITWILVTQIDVDDRFGHCWHIIYVTKIIVAILDACFHLFNGLPSGMSATDIVATFNNNFNIFSQSKEMVSSL